MKVFRNSTTALTLAAIMALTILGSGCEYARKVIAKDKLNQGTIKYNKGDTKGAQEFFKDASETDPSNPITWLYLGATLVKDYNKEPDDAKKKEIANHALEVYRKAISIASENCVVVDNALSYMAVIHDDMKDFEEWRKVMEERAGSPCTTKKEIKAQSYYSIGQKYWQRAFDQTTRYQDPAQSARDPFHYRKMDYSPEALADKRRTEENVAKGFEYFEKSLEIDPEYTEPMFYKSLLYRERQKLTKEESKRKEFEQMAIRISDEATALQKKKIATAAAEQKASEAAAPTS
jgi:tetratricopeptide (TPR) repeat protein